MYKNVIYISISTLILTYLFINIPNKSNFPQIYYIPIMVSLITKYIMGDFDKGYVYTISDLVYWFYNLLISFLFILLINKYNLKIKK